jgi:hypothetical protein
MLSMLKEALEWLNRAEQARKVAGQLTDPGAKKAVLELAESFDRLARAAATPAVLRRRELARKDQDSESGTTCALKRMIPVPGCGCRSPLATSTCGSVSIRLHNAARTYIRGRRRT